MEPRDSASAKKSDTWLHTGTSVPRSTPEEYRACAASEASGAAAAVSEVATRLMADACSIGNWSIQVMDVTPEYVDVRVWEVEQGSFFSHDDVDRRARVAVLGRTVAG